MKASFEFPRSFRAFTLTELLALFCLALVGVSILAPVLAKTRSDTQAIRCLENTKHLAEAWLMYAADHNGKLVPNFQGGAAQGGNFPSSIGPGWASGWMDWTTSTDNTNLLFLVNEKYAALAPYVRGATNLFKCPSDTALSPAQRARGWSQRVRSYSESTSLGQGNAQSGPWNPIYQQVTSISDLKYPTPAQTFVHVDEDATSIDDPAFYGPNPTSLVDMPATRHNGAATFSFADGHAQLHLWTGSLRTHITSTNDPDLSWLSFHSQRTSPDSY